MRARSQDLPVPRESERVRPAASRRYNICRLEPEPPTAGTFIKGLNMRAVTAIAFAVSLALITSSCSKDTPVQPTPPSGPPAPPPASAPPPATSIATVEISGIKYTATTDPKFLVTETSGKSGATISRVQVFDAGGNSDITDQSCWRQVIRVEAGKTLDIFDAGSDTLGYCAPTTTPGTPSIRIVLAFLDDEGHPGTASATAAAP